jgi:hypothetical protein
LWKKAQSTNLQGKRKMVQKIGIPLYEKKKQKIGVFRTKLVEKGRTTKIFNTFEVWKNKYQINGINYINTNEIPGELSRENMIPSHVKITCYLHTRKDHRCYGYIINRAFRSESEMVWYFIGVYIINRTLHGRFGDTKFFFSC